MGLRGKIVIHEEHFPLLYVQCIGAFDDDDWDQLIERLTALIREGQPFGWINDARTRHLPDAGQRARIAKVFRETPNIEAIALGFSTVSTSPLVRGIVTAVEWLAPNRIPNKFVETVLEAEDFVWGRLDPARDLPFKPSYGPECSSRDVL